MVLKDLKKKSLQMTSDGKRSHDHTQASLGPAFFFGIDRCVVEF
jgi:hypothetical protein